MKTKTRVVLGNGILKEPYSPYKVPEDFAQAFDMWSRIQNLMSWLRLDPAPKNLGGDWPEKYKHNLHRFLGYWSHTPKSLRMSAKVLKRLNN